MVNQGEKYYEIKKIACYLLFVAMLFALGGCNPGEKAGSDGLKICIVTNAGVDDGNFNEDVYNGILSFIDKTLIARSTMSRNRKSTS